MSLSDALRQLRESLEAGEPPAESLAEAAQDFGLRPELLLRKWVEGMGAPPEAWQAAHKTRVAGLVQLKADAETAAREKAREVAAQYTAAPVIKALAGRRFVYKGQAYAFATLQSDNPAYAIRAIRIADTRLVNLPARIWDEIRDDLARPK
jgi:transposase-like protein